MICAHPVCLVGVGGDQPQRLRHRRLRRPRRRRSRRNRPRPMQEHHTLNPRLYLLRNEETHQAKLELPLPLEGGEVVHLFLIFLSLVRVLLPGRTALVAV